jgi:hypothetical protein
MSEMHLQSSTGIGKQGFLGTAAEKQTFKVPVRLWCFSPLVFARCEFELDVRAKCGANSLGSAITR